jgi:DNA-binding NtrC family response regulator
MERASRASGQEKTLSDEALKVMLAYDWPGNVRELENCLERTCAFTSGPLIHVADLPPAIAWTAAVAPGERKWERLQFQQDRPHGRTGEADHSQRHCRIERRQIASRPLLGIGKTTLYRKLKDYAEHAY